MDDNCIVALYWNRDPDALAESDQKYGAYCFAIAHRILHNREDSEECVNETWLRAWNAIPPQRPQRLSLFFAKITRNLAFDAWSARSAQKRGGGDIHLVLDELAECLSSESNPASEYEAKELGQFIRQFVNHLPERERNIFLRRYFFAETAAEIAARFGITENHVLVILSRTRKKLKLQLQKEGFMDESK